MKRESARSGPELSAQAKLIVDGGRNLPPRRAWDRASTWRAIDSRILRHRRWQSGALVGVGLGGLVALGVLLLAPWLGGQPRTQARVQRSAAWREIDLGPVGRLTLAPGTRVRLPSPEPNPDDPYRLDLDEGQLCAQINHRDLARQGPFEVDAPQLKVIVVGTRFCVFAGQGASWASVEEGRVRVQGGTESSVVVGAGQCIRADEPRLAFVEPPVPSSTATAIDLGGLRASSTARIDARVPSPTQSGPSALSVESALYEAGLKATENHEGARSLAIWDEYRIKYPGGVFATEVDLYRLRELAAEAPAPMVISAAEEMSRNHRGDWRGSEADLIEADVMRLRLGRPADALPLYERVLASERRADLAERAAYGQCMSVRSLAREVEAKARFKQYLERFPSGRHRAEIERLLTSD